MRIVLLCLVSGYVIFLPGVVGKALEKWHVAEWVGTQKKCTEQKGRVNSCTAKPPWANGGK